MKKKLKCLCTVVWRGLFDHIDSLPVGFYYVTDYMGSTTILEVLKHEGELMVARAGRNKMLPIKEYSDGIFTGPILVPPSCCLSQSDLARIGHWGNTEISMPAPLLCSFLLRTALWCVRHLLRSLRAKCLSGLSLWPFSYFILSNVKVHTPLPASASSETEVKP
jgi:hypothetical protein